MEDALDRAELDRLRRRCGQLRWLAFFMVVTVGLLLAVLHVVGPIMGWRRGHAEAGEAMLTSLIVAFPSACYLFAVWSIGQAMGELARGRLFQRTVVSALRRVGLALGVGGVFSVFIATNLSRLLLGGPGSFLHWDVSGMTLGMVGGALFLLGGVLERAGRIEAELEEMI
jgi:hypothetical protein